MESSTLLLQAGCCSLMVNFKCSLRHKSILFKQIAKHAGVSGTPVDIRRAALNNMQRLLPKMPLAGYAAAILHPLMRVLDGNIDELRRDAADTICAVAISLGPDFSLFVPSIRRVQPPAVVVSLLLAGLCPLDAVGMQGPIDAPVAEICLALMIRCLTQLLSGVSYHSADVLA